MSNKPAELNCLLSGKSRPSSGKQDVWSPIGTFQVSDKAATGLGELDAQRHNRERHTQCHGGDKPLKLLYY